MKRSKTINKNNLLKLTKNELITLLLKKERKRKAKTITNTVYASDNRIQQAVCDHNMIPAGRGDFQCSKCGRWGY